MIRDSIVSNVRFVSIVIIVSVVCKKKILPIILNNKRKKKKRANAPPTPPSGIAAGRPTTERAEPKLALENAVEMMLESPALQLATFLARLYFFATPR